MARRAAATPPVRGEAHVWRVRLDLDDVTLRGISESLSPDERARAGKFYFRADRERFVAARGALRAILSRYTGLAPRLIRFSYDRYGKPRLNCEPGDGLLRFNVSHSKDLALYAVATGREVGVDLEYVRSDFASLEVAEHFFSRREVEALRALPPVERVAAFFDCWTRKEAYIKARGEGLSHPLYLFTVSLAPGQAAALLLTDEDEQEAARWSLFELLPGPDYRAALAVEGGLTSLRCWRWP
jgi:4'-phosphopantetheinyl transferase